MSDPEQNSENSYGTDPHVLLRVIAKFLIPLIALFAFYVQFHGDYGPGGGFQAGVILAASVILYALIFGLAEAKKAFPPRLIRYGMTLGVYLSRRARRIGDCDDCDDCDFLCLWFASA